MVEAGEGSEGRVKGFTLAKEAMAACKKRRSTHGNVGRRDTESHTGELAVEPGGSEQR